MIPADAARVLACMSGDLTPSEWARRLDVPARRIAAHCAEVDLRLALDLAHATIAGLRLALEDSC